MNDKLPSGDPLPSDTVTAPTSVIIADWIGAGPLPYTFRAVHVRASGTFNFKDGSGITQNMTSADFVDKTVYGYQVSEVLSGTTLTGRLMK